MVEVNEMVEKVKEEFARQQEESNPTETPEKDKEETIVDEDSSDDDSGADDEISSEDNTDEEVADDDNSPSAELQARAEAVGVDLDTLSALGEKADLFLTRMELAGKDNAGEEDAGGKKEEEAEEEAPAINFPTEEQLVEGGLDEDIAKSISEGLAGVVAMVQDQNKQLGDISSSREAEQVEAQAVKEIEDFENRVSGLGEAYEAKFGKGGLMEVKKGTDEYKAREELYETMQDLKDIATKRGQTLSTNDAFDRAVKFVASDISDSKKVATLKDKARSRSKKFITPPNGEKKGGKGDPGDEALAAVQAILDDNS